MLFICFGGVLGLYCCARFSLLAASGGYCLAAGLRLLCGGFPCGARALGHIGFGGCATWLPGPRAEAQVCCTGLVAPRHVGSSWTRDRTCVSYRWILYH